ncbi:MAG: NAD(P)/FAD-dependent oxidoreductase, partial [Sporomusaceae bacterium]|nr:NAD(P)/FAD-dependent oxidoreductase [Sporomusaceae bacterium]
VRGNELYHQLEDELDLDIRWTGSLVVAALPDDMKTLESLYERGKENGVPGLEILSREELLEREPHLNPTVCGALWAPSAGVFLPFGAALAFAENAVRNGVKVFTESPVMGINMTNGKVVSVSIPQGIIQTDYIINTAGIHADDVAKMADDLSFKITPRKGEYILFDRSVSHLVNSVIFPVPRNDSKGILIAPTIHGNIFIGPNAQNIADKEDVATTSEGMNEIITGAKRLLEGLPLNAAITEFSGLRAVADVGDFVIRPSSTAQGLMHAGGIQSPGLTSAPAIAEEVARILSEQGVTLVKKEDFNARNPRKVIFRELSLPEKEAAIAENPLYGRVICRCETITEGEIVDAIHSPCGAKTVDAVKRRTRAGMGRCQGGFCGPRVTAILARELNIPITAVRKETVNSYLFFDKIPGTCEVADHE